jgi:cytochrome bd ubiquinol oxidase subunit II
MEILWFFLVGFLFVGYVLLDGYDLGTGALHLYLAKTDGERKQNLAAIAPFWDANEVWLLAGGGTLYFAFPPVYASGFSGFYLPLMVVLWLFILRAVSIDFRNHIKSPVWAPLWDAGLMGSSALLALFFGVALGNVVRGVPLNAEGEFFLPLWTNFQTTGPDIGILDWYTVLVGVFAMLAIFMHGATWIFFKVAGPVAGRARAAASVLLPVIALLFIAVTFATFEVQRQAAANLAVAPWGIVFPAGGIAAAAACYLCLKRNKPLPAFLASSAFLVMMLGTAAFTLFPYVLPSNISAEAGLTVYNSNPGPYGLRIGLMWWIPGMLLAVGYTVFTHMHFSETIPMPVEDDPNTNLEMIS